MAYGSINGFQRCKVLDAFGSLMHLVHLRSYHVPRVPRPRPSSQLTRLANAAQLQHLRLGHVAMQNMGPRNRRFLGFLVKLVTCCHTENRILLLW